MMNQIQLHRLDLNLLVIFEMLMEERSVARAADRLGKTPSAVSHALGRLRDQLGDPLLVRVGGEMRPSPFALELIEDIRPILRSIQRVVQPPRPFDPATSNRVFRIAAPAITAVISEVSARVQELAPDIGLEWLAPGSRTYAQVIDGQVDIALLGTDSTLPDGVTEHRLPPIPRYCFARRGHPAIGAWSREAWLRWPHVVVGMSNAARQTVEERIASLGVSRRIGARIPEFAGVGPLLARTDLLANQIAVVLLPDLDALGLRVLEVPAEMPSFEFRFFWNTRLSNDPGNRWIREIVIASFTALIVQAEKRIAAEEVIRPLPA